MKALKDRIKNTAGGVSIGKEGVSFEQNQRMMRVGTEIF